MAAVVQQVVNELMPPWCTPACFGRMLQLAATASQLCLIHMRMHCLPSPYDCCASHSMVPAC